MNVTRRSLVATAGAIAAGAGLGSRAYGGASGKASDAARKMLDAHGGKAAWSGLKTLFMRREHNFPNGPGELKFTIHGDMATERIYQRWAQPEGEVVWDGERAWSAGWPLASTFRPRFLMGIGFFLVTMPWFANSKETKLVSLTRRADLHPSAPGERLVLSIEFEGWPARRPKGTGTQPTSFDLFLNPETHVLDGVHIHWRYAGQLDIAGPSARDEAFQAYVIESYETRRGLILPVAYSVYGPSGPATVGRYFDYALDTPLDESRFRPESYESVVFDTSSSYQRLPSS